jgi:hypothetical protein
VLQGGGLFAILKSGSRDCRPVVCGALIQHAGSLDNVKLHSGIGRENTQRTADLLHRGSLVQTEFNNRLEHIVTYFVATICSDCSGVCRTPREHAEDLHLPDL